MNVYFNFSEDMLRLYKDDVGNMATREYLLEEVPNKDDQSKQNQRADENLKNSEGTSFRRKTTWWNK